jgi:hypothetical protein
MPELLPLLVLETSFRVPGLGVLAVPAPAAAAGLLAYALHTPVAVTLLADGQPPQALAGTVEELAHDGQPPRRVLLLDFDPSGPLPSSTRLQVADAAPSLL